MCNRSLVVIIVAALLALAAGIHIGTRTQETKKPEAALSAEAISRFFATRLNDERGQAQRIDQWRGKILVVNFWAAWCQPCREEMPAFNRLQAKYAANGVQFVGIALDSAANVAQFRKALNSAKYELHANSFQRSAELAIEKAKAKNIDGATLAYLDMTMTCVRCHQHVREEGIGLAPRARDDGIGR